MTHIRRQINPFLLGYILLLVVCGIVLFRAADLSNASTQSFNISRGPYLQKASTDQITIRWRTGSAMDSVVQYGTDPNSLNQSVSDPALKSEHIVTLTGLTADTRYYYSVGSTGSVLAQGTDYFFETHPLVGSTDPFRIWAIGDSGTANGNAAAVRDAFVTVNGGSHTDLWLMLGDNAYNTGTDNEYQNAVYDMYPSILRNTVLWPTIGNHDLSTSQVANQSGPYYDMFTLPTNGEVGGVASQTESYYSFDYANVHFVVLNSMDGSLSSTSTMAAWLEDDLAATDQEWVIAYWHHPPYTKGSHDSDTEGRLRSIRQNFLPILEDYGVDLVLSGHSHSYERSYLLDGHYGLSDTLTSDMVLDDGDGNPSGDGAYQKYDDAHDGAIYIVAGSSGKISGGSLDHPAMYYSASVLGSVIIDINHDQMEVQFIDNNAVVRDLFRVYQQPDNIAEIISPVPGSVLNEDTLPLIWTDVLANAYMLEVGSTVGGSEYFSGNVGTVTSYTVTDLPRDGRSIYVRLSTLQDQWYARDYEYTAVGGLVSFVAQVLQSSDDAEQYGSGGTMYLNSSDLELVTDSSQGVQTVGIRFQNVEIPPNVVISSAYLEFETDETTSTPTSVVIRGEDVDSADTFMGVNNNITTRPLTANNVSWSIPAWNVLNEKHQSPDVSAVVEEVLGRANWQSGNDLAFIISGSGQRIAESFDGEPANAPKLFIEYTVQRPTPTPPPPPTPDPMLTPTLTPTPTATPVVEPSAEMLSPEPETELPCEDVVFSWSDVNATGHYLYIGTSVGSTDLFFGDAGTSNSMLVPDLPTEAESIHVRLWTEHLNWSFNDYEYAPCVLPTNIGEIGIVSAETPLNWIVILFSTALAFTIGLFTLRRKPIGFY